MPMTASAETLKVVVQDQNGNAIPEAKVQIGSQEQTTDESGNTMFSDVTGAQSLTVIAIGFSSKRLNTTAGQTEVTVVLAPIQTVDAVVVVGTRSIGRRGTAGTRTDRSCQQRAAEPYPVNPKRVVFFRC